MAKSGFALFETSIGHCGIAWTERGIAGVQLPEGSETRTRERLEKRFPDDEELPPPPTVRAAQRDISALLRGEPRDLSNIPLDMQGLPPFRRRVYEMARKVPAGSTCSYGELAKRLGSPGAARAVGQALGRNPFAIVVPCHRVLAANGRLGGFTAEGGVKTKQRMLAIEGASGKPARAAGTKRVRSALAFDPKRAVRALRRKDPSLASVFDAIGACELASEMRQSDGVFPTLTEAIVAQQLSAKAAATIHGRLCALFPGAGGGGPRPEQIARASETKLRSAGLSRAKALALGDLARKTLAGEIPSLEILRELPDEEVVARLSSVRGIGRWTAEMFLIFRLARPDVLPVDDFALRKGFAIAMGLDEMPAPNRVASHGEQWAPWRTVASWYLWRVAERGRL